MTTKNSKKGFTLVELVVVIAILAILAAIAIPVVNSIINTASRNSAISNADSIELQIKNCQADIAARNTERYADAVSNPSNIHIDTVATKTGITTAFEMVTYNNYQYYPVWDTASDKCYFVAVGNSSDSNAPAAGTRIDDAGASPLTPDGTNVICLTDAADGSGGPSTTVSVTSL